MSFRITLLIVVAIFAQNHTNASQETGCAICPNSISGIACTGLRTWRYCFGSMIDTVDRSCADDEICTTATKKFCMPEGGPINASCNKLNCNKCTEYGNNDFACLGSNKFARCMSGKVSEEYQGNCPTGYVCSTESNDMCVSNLEANPSCSN